MNLRKTRSIIGLGALALIAWMVTATAALAQVEQAHLRIDGMT